MTSGYEALRESADWVRARAPEIPTVAVVLGSGLSAFTDRLEHGVAFDYAAIPHWPPTSAIGHPGKLVLGTVNGRRIAALAGRAHYYEGHDLRTVLLPSS